MKKAWNWQGIIFSFGAVAAALVFTTIVLLLAGAPPLKTYESLIVGSVGSKIKIADVMVAWIPLLLSTAGLLITFTAGLWNIGIEGQITLGAIFTTWALRLLQDSSLPPGIIITISFLAGALGGMIWAALAGGLKAYGGVNEIFSGLGLNFVATAITLWLIFGPWKRPGTGSMSGTQPFPEQLWLPMVKGLRFSWYSLIVALLAILIVFLILRGTYFGLKLKAVGKNGRAAFLLGIPTTRYMIFSFLVCGLFGGLAGAAQVVGVYHRLIPSISSGYGFLGLMVGMLVNYQAVWAAPVALFFVALNIGSIQLPIVFQIDSSFAGVLQGTLVLSVIMMDGVRRRFLKRSQAQPGEGGA